MAERPGPREEDDVKRRLADLAPLVGFPPTPNLAESVDTELARAAATSPRASLGATSRPARWAVAAAFTLLLVAVLVTLVPAARSSLAEALGVAGVRIFRFETTPAVPPSPAGDDLRLGRRLTWAEAQAAVPYAIAAPTLAGYDEPDEIYLHLLPPEGMVSFVYRPRSALPATGQTDVGALLTQFPGRTDQPVATKGVGPTATVEPVTVGDERGFWIEGEAHVFVYRDARDEVRYDEYRLAGNVLLWEQDGLTFRFESALDKEQALRIANGVRPIDRPR